jgi:hypothetical protein
MRENVVQMKLGVVFADVFACEFASFGHFPPKKEKCATKRLCLGMGNEGALLFPSTLNYKGES